MPRIASVPSTSPQPMAGLMRDQAAYAVHELGAGLLRRVTRGEENRRLGQRMHRHMQEAREVGDRAAHAEGEGDDAHVLDRRISEQPLDVLLA